MEYTDNKDDNTLQKEESRRLSDLKRGESAIIVEIRDDCDKSTRQRLLDLGFVKGSTVFVQNVSPMGDPIAYNIHQTQVALRKADALFIEIETDK